MRKLASSLTSFQNVLQRIYRRNCFRNAIMLCLGKTSPILEKLQFNLSRLQVFSALMINNLTPRKNKDNIMRGKKKVISCASLMNSFTLSCKEKAFFFSDCINYWSINGQQRSYPTLYADWFIYTARSSSIQKGAITKKNRRVGWVPECWCWRIRSSVFALIYAFVLLKGGSSRIIRWITIIQYWHCCWMGRGCRLRSRSSRSSPHLLPWGRMQTFPVCAHM